MQVSVLRTVREALSLNVIKHLGGIGKQAAASHACHRPLLCVRAQMFFQSMFAPHNGSTAC